MRSTPLFEAYPQSNMHPASLACLSCVGNSCFMRSGPPSFRSSPLQKNLFSLLLGSWDSNVVAAMDIRLFILVVLLRKSTIGDHSMVFCRRFRSWVCDGRPAGGICRSVTTFVLFVAALMIESECYWCDAATFVQVHIHFFMCIPHLLLSVSCEE